MLIQVFSKYYNLAQAGRVTPLACPDHYDETGQFQKALYWLMHKEEDTKIVLYCTACGYKQIAGLQLYQNIINEMKRINEWDINQNLETTELLEQLDGLQS
jgi:hypothetical protein